MTFLGFIPPLFRGSHESEWHDCRVDLAEHLPMSRKEDRFAIQMLARWGRIGMDDHQHTFATEFWRFSIP